MSPPEYSLSGLSFTSGINISVWRVGLGLYAHVQSEPLTEGVILCLWGTTHSRLPSNSSKLIVHHTHATVYPWGLDEEEEWQGRRRSGFGRRYHGLLVCFSANYENYLKFRR